MPNAFAKVGDVGKVVSDLVTPHGSQASQDTTDEGANQTGVAACLQGLARSMFRLLFGVRDSTRYEVAYLVQSRR